VIVVIGSPLHRSVASGGPPVAVGLAAGIAMAAAEAGSEVQLVGRVGEDPAGDALLLALSRLGVGHVAVLRDPAHPTPVAPDDEPEAADPMTEPPPDGWSSLGAPGSASLDRGDVELALRYLDGFRVAVVAERLDGEALAVVTEASDYARACLVALVGPDAEAPEGAIVLEAPGADPDGAFARTVGRLAAALDGGAEAEVALASAIAAAGWERVDADG
jgi:hypothetical protein